MRHLREILSHFAGGMLVHGSVTHNSMSLANIYKSKEKAKAPTLIYRSDGQNVMIDVHRILKRAIFSRLI